MKTKDMTAMRCNCCQRNLPASCFRLRRRKNDRGYKYTMREQPCNQCRSYVNPPTEAYRERQRIKRRKRYWEKKRAEQAKLNGKRAQRAKKPKKPSKKYQLLVECRTCKEIFPRASYYRENYWQCPGCCCAETQARHARKRIEDPEWHEQGMAKLRQWKADNPERERLRRRIRNNRRLERILENGTHDFAHEQWLSLIDFWDYTCAYCDKRGGNLERDHVIPLAKGGEHTLSNIVPSCGDCNRSKVDLDMRTWMNDEQRYEAILMTMGDAERTSNV